MNTNERGLRQRQKTTSLVLLITGLFLFSPASVFAHGGECKYELDQSGGEIGTAKVKIKNTKLEIKIDGASPHTMYTIWIDFRKRQEMDALPADFPVGVPPVTPAFSTRAKVTEGVGLDRNAFVTSHNGKAKFKVDLRYKLLESGVTPIVGGLAMQGMNRVGGFWMRQYPIDPDTAPSLQLTRNNPAKPLLVYNTAAGITIVRHPDFITHGHTPGVGDVDHFSAWKGDFPDTCLP